MKALSIRQPWAWAILHAGKRVENREWTWAPMWRETFLIHAAKGVGTRQDFEDAVEDILFLTGLPQPEGLAVAHYRRGEDCGGIWIPDPELARGAIIGRARLVGAGINAWRGNRWAVEGATHLALADVEEISWPLPYKGALGFFDVPDEMLAGRSWKAAEAPRGR